MQMRLSNDEPTNIFGRFPFNEKIVTYKKVCSNFTIGRFWEKSFAVGKLDRPEIEGVFIASAIWYAKW